MSSLEFLGRDKEIEIIHKLARDYPNEGTMLVITGKRRVGKTSLALQSCKDRKHLYLFVERSAEKILCKTFKKEIEGTLGIRIFGNIDSFRDLFELLLDYAEKEELTLIIDEFQDFAKVNPSIFSSMQNLWDRKYRKTRMRLICIGSIFSMMNQIFQNSKEPLFGRANLILQLKPLKIDSLRKILLDHGITDFEALFDLYLLTGGMPHYLKLACATKALHKEAFIQNMFSEVSSLIDEGKKILIQEFGTDYQIYFSILAEISAGRTERNLIEQAIGKPISNYLFRLENDYDMIEQVRPCLGRFKSKIIKFKIKDLFLNFWFRFVYKNMPEIQKEQYEAIRAKVLSEYEVYSGRILERFFIDLLARNGTFSKLGPFWTKGYQNEIDIVAIDDAKKTILIAEVKRQKKRIHLSALKEKALALFPFLPKDYAIQFQGFSLESIPSFFSKNTNL